MLFQIPLPPHFYRPLLLPTLSFSPTASYRLPRIFREDLPDNYRALGNFIALICSWVLQRAAGERFASAAQSLTFLQSSSSGFSILAVSLILQGYKVYPS